MGDRSRCDSGSCHTYGISIHNYLLVVGAVIRHGNCHTLNHLMIMHYYLDATDGLNMADVGNDYCYIRPNWVLNVGSIVIMV